MPFTVDLSSATLVILTTSVSNPARGLASTVMTAASFVSKCFSNASAMQAAYGPESNNYMAYAYHSGGKVYLCSKSQYDSAVFTVL